ncbi:MAG: hypothetical protein OQK24_08305 [Magnetovibrio sp.]|nr:hypothetical protein [Magnetovibrio sp.]
MRIFQRFISTTRAMTLVGTTIVSALVWAPQYAQAQGGADVINFREEMRIWVETISDNARSFNPNFMIVVEDGLPLISKPDPQDDTQLFPARGYISAIDGVLQHDLIKFLEPLKRPDDAPKEDPAITEARERMTMDAETAEIMGVGVLNLEYAKDAKTIDGFYRSSDKRGFSAYVAQSKLLGRIPKYPKYAVHANPKSLDKISQAKNFIYIAHSQGFGTSTDFVQALSMTNYDVVITSVFHGRNPLTPQEVNRLKYKKLGARRLVLAEMDISSAATYHYYWQPDWEIGKPEFISVPHRTDPDRYRTQYWKPDWQAVIAGDTSSYLYGILAQGFDGVVLKGTDAWRYFEGDQEDQ